ncbi:unnamed protein product [Staurois parvus]|uniref:Uncharacterized protein n=1 Tax=Staurois parvus TaxID=386267 RepID=A0ABN9GPF0_9NEOB|nr:unnamed protein product [Staurois parvus]
MTRDCGHSTGDDQRLWTVQEMTADLWGGGERVPEFDRYPLLTSAELFFDLTAGCPVRMSEKRCAL